MKTRNNHSRIALGTFPLAGVFNPITKEQAVTVVETFLSGGGYYIDTAPMYGYGSVERLLGEILQSKKRDDYVIISKCGKHIDETKQTWVPRATYTDVIKQCEESLQRLNLDYLDLYFVHEPDRVTPYEETMRALIELQKQGKIREIGISNVTLTELKEFRKYADVTIIQNRFSFINRSIEPDYDQYLSKNNIQFIPYHILEIAQLTGSVLEDKHLGKNDFRNTLPYFQEEKVNTVRTWIKQYIQPIAQKQGCTIGQLMIAWTLQQEHIPYVLVGTTKTEYVRINMQADAIILTEEVMVLLEQAYTALENYVCNTFHKSMREFRELNSCYF